ncbi:hypothetical protein AB1N83_014095 [Pleurotus pulmonarius]
MPTTETITHQTNLYSTNLIDNEIQRIHSLANGVDWNEDTLLLPMESGTSSNFQFKAFTAYKCVGQKIHPVSGVYPEDIKVIRKIPEDPLKSLPVLPKHPPKFTPGKCLTEERLKGMEVNKDNFLLPEEERLFNHILQLNEITLAFEEQDRGTLRKDYFSDYIMPTVPHTPWEYKNIPIPPGIKDKVIDILKNKIDAGVYEPCQSSYRGRWFCVLKKNGVCSGSHNRGH